MDRWHDLCAKILPMWCFRHGLLFPSMWPDRRMLLFHHALSPPGMGQYSKAVSEKFSSGSALLSISESEMEKKLGISNPLHRRKLGLALKEMSNPRM